MEYKESELARLQQENENLRKEIASFRNNAAIKSADLLLFDSSPSGILIVNEKYEIEYANAALEKITGFKIDEVKGKDFRDTLNEKTKKLFIDRHERRRNGETTPAHFEISTFNRNGDEIHLEITSSSHTDINGNLKTLTQVIDITEKKRAFSALNESEEIYRTLIENSPDGIVLSDQQGIFKTVNKKLLEMHGYGSFDELLNATTTVFDLIAEEDRQLAWDNADKVEKGHFIGSVYYTLLKKDGSTFPAELNTVLLKNESGDISGFLTIYRDLTERQKAELELKESQIFLKSVFDAIQDGISVLDRDMNVVMTNRWMEVMYRKNMPLQGKKCYCAYHQSDEPCEKCPSLETKLTGNPSVEVVPLKEDGQQKGWIELSSFPVKDENGKVINIIEYVKDITEKEISSRTLRETSRRLSNIMHAANDGMWDWHLATNEVIFDPRYYQMAGYEPDEFPHSLEEFQERVHSEDIDQVMQSAKDHLEGVTERFIVEFRFKQKEGDWMWILGRGKIIEWDNAGNPTRLVGTHTDISELKRIQSDLEDAKNRAEESDRLKSAFLANMSHEIRTPMNGILGFADLLATEGLTREESEEYLKIIRSSGARMLDTINDIIDISKIEAGQTEVNLSVANINDHLAYLHNFFLPEAKRRGLALKFTKSLSEQKAAIKTDHSKVIAIYTNLIKNSLKFTKEGKIEYGYKIKGDELLFYVSDTGIGIDKSRQEAIFDRFVQADLTITKAYEGSGLGLSISKGFVNLLGGKIWVESESGIGSTFYFSLPYNETSKPESNEECIENFDPGVEKIRNLTVLIVEDDESARFYLNELLKKRCKNILLTKTGSEAVEQCKLNRGIGLILMDMKLPELDGYEATRQIRNFNKSVPIIGQTAYALVGDRSKVIEAGCNDYLSKPIEKKELFEVISKYV